jgi:hypothetical protein
MPGYNKGTIGIKAGTQVWRIEKMDVVEQKADTFGTFFSGDCYIILRTKEEKAGKSFDLHYWLGEKCSQDEQGAVAYKAVELDDLLGGRPVQYRETQGHESPLFLSVFPNGVKYLDGGIASAFNHVDPSAYKPRLLHLKGKRHVRVQQVELATSSLNDGDVFILDCGLTLFQWNGKSANKYEKFKGLEMVTTIKDKERGGKAKVVFMDSGKPNPDDKLFWETLGGKDGIKDEKSGGSDDEVKAHEAELVKISNASGELKIEPVAKGRLEKTNLDTNDVFLVDTGTEVYCWIGKGANKEERKKGMEHAAEYLKTAGRPSWTPLTRVVEGSETPVFKSFFFNWPEPKSKVETVGGKTVVKRPPDVEALYKQTQAAEEKMVDKGDGKIDIWRIESMKKAPLPKDQYGQFYAGDSYVLLYSYKINGKDAWIIYFWQGRDSSTDEKAASAIVAAQMDKDMGGAPVQVRVVQNKEPNHFLTLFKGKMIVHEGGHASGFKNRGDKDSYDADGISLFHIKGTNEMNTRAIQVPEKAASLNSGDCFALLTPDAVHIWQGKGANATELKTAKSVTAVIAGKRKVVDVQEGKEPEAFWTAVGGKGEYATAKELGDDMKQPRLFHCSANSGQFYAEEIFNYVQDDLISDDIMILDCFTEVYVWVGKDSSREEKEQALKTALDYVAKAPDGRSPDTPIFRIEQGNEPLNFSCHFIGWDPKKATDFSDPYAKKLAAIQGKSGAGPVGKVEVKSPSNAASPKAAAGPVRVTADQVGYADPSKKSYTLSELKAGVANIDPSKKEMYLSDAEFQSVFKMNKDAFTKLAAWKQKDERKKAGLF